MSKIPDLGCSDKPFKLDTYSFNRESVFKNHKYFGFILYADNEKIVFVTDNGNPYMTGDVREIYYSLQ